MLVHVRARAVLALTGLLVTRALGGHAVGALPAAQLGGQPARPLPAIRSTRLPPRPRPWAARHAACCSSSSGFVTTKVGEGPLARLWDRLLLRIPGVGIVYGSTQVTRRSVPEPEGADVPQGGAGAVAASRHRGGSASSPGTCRTCSRSASVQDVSCVFVPHTPNPASGFVHYVPKKDLIELDWSVEDRAQGDRVGWHRAAGHGTAG